MKAEGLLPNVIPLPCKSFEARVAKRKQEEENALKAEGLLPNVIPLPYKNVEASSPENQSAKEGNGQSWGARIWQNRVKIGAGVACLAYVAANVGLYIAGNSSSVVCDPVNSTENDTLSLNLPSTCPNLMQHPYWLQCKIDENVTKLANAEKWYVDSSSSIVSNPVDSTGNYTLYLHSLVLTIAGIVMSYGLDMDIAVPRESFGL